ncbi:MAG: phytanoyl-CoA dioxygenase family protein [Proteobacteria bacterium]|nr:phytanoyl-CoA dioxygenase family protein [Pseudomonadota bacterium]
MEKSELFPVDQEDIDAFWRDGAVVLRGVLNEHWRRELAEGITLNLAQPTSRRVDWVRDETTGDHLFHDQLTVAHNPHYERCMLASPLGPLAARFMASPTALAFYATVFVRSPGTRSRTPWHQDQTYWCADGRQALSIWTALDPVPAGTELEFVRGSHLWEKPLAQTNFDEQNLGGEREIEDIDFMPMPDFSGADRDRFEFLGWPMEPGDVLVFHGMTVHGGSGDLPAGLQRRSISTQWLGPDARVTDRPGGCNPDWLPELAQNGIGLGDYPACAMCPTITAEGTILP